MTQETGFRCDDCAGRFPSQQALESHRQEAHVAQTELHCSACGTAFTNQRELQEHARKEHSA